MQGLSAMLGYLVVLTQRQMEVMMRLMTDLCQRRHGPYWSPISMVSAESCRAIWTITVFWYGNLYIYINRTRVILQVQTGLAQCLFATIFDPLSQDGGPAGQAASSLYLACHSLQTCWFSKIPVSVPLCALHFSAPEHMTFLTCLENEPRLCSEGGCCLSGPVLFVAELKGVWWMRQGTAEREGRVSGFRQLNVARIIGFYAWHRVPVWCLIRHLN